MELFYTLVFIGGALLFIWIIMKASQDLESTKKFIEEVYQKYDFSPDKEHYDNIKTHGIAIDHKQNKILLMHDLDKLVWQKIKLIDPNDILEVKLVENGETVTRTGRGSQVIGATVGGLLAGGIGMIAGALTGKKYSDKKVEHLQLELVINDILEPIHRFTFMYSSKGMPQNSDKYKEHYEKAYFWFKLIEVMIYQDKELNKVQVQ